MEKTLQFWQIDKGDKLPLGLPTLKMTFTDPRQIDLKLIDKRDEI